MKLSSIIGAALLSCTLLAQPVFANGPMQVEKLNRGLIAIRQGNGYYLSWRLLANEPYNTGFNVYRGQTLLNSTPIAPNANGTGGATIYTDANTPQQTGVSTYTVRAVINGVVQAASDPAILINNTHSNGTEPRAGYIEVPLRRPPTGQFFGTYSPNDGSVGDLTGDGVYDIIIKWEPSNAIDNGETVCPGTDGEGAGCTGATRPCGPPRAGGPLTQTTDNVLIDAYKLDGTFLWRIDLGPNIRAGAHYTQFMVYDFDGSGKAQIMMKTAEGTRQGTSNPNTPGAFIKGPPGSTPNHNAIHRTTGTGGSCGRILSGPEYLTIFDGETGAELATINYNPPRGTISGWGDNYGNRVDRFNAVVAYLDGERPSAVFQRGYYGRMTLWAVDWRDGQLTQRWFFDSNATGNSNYAGQGNHQISVADVDNSGRHSIITGAAVIKYDGTGLWTSRLGHGDALHVAHMIKGNPIPQVFTPQESGTVGMSLRNANDGSVIFSRDNSADVGRAVAAELDASMPGFKFWGAGMGMYDITGAVVGNLPLIPNNDVSQNFVIWWDGDLSRELLDRNQINKWSVRNNNHQRLLTAGNVSTNNGSKRTPILTADIFGDWREEVIWRTANDSALRIYTTTMTTTHRLVTMMHDPTYRVAVAWQNSSYNQPPHPGYYIASDMNFPPEPLLNVAVLGSGSQPHPCVTSPGSAACCEVSPNHSSCQTAPPDWILIGNGEFIDNLVTFDIENAQKWSIHDNFAAQEKAFGDRDYLVIAIPEELEGAEWISTSMDSRRNFSLNTIIRFTMKKDGLVSIAYEDRVGTKPEWLAEAGFEETDKTISVRDDSNLDIIDRTFTIYEKVFTAGEVVSMGINSNDGTAQSLMYLVAVTEPKTQSISANKTKTFNNSLSVVRRSNNFIINYTVKNRGNVRIDLFDIKGNRVRTLVNTSRNAGTYRELVPVDGLAAGMYVVRFNAGRQTLREKVLLTR